MEFQESFELALAQKPPPHSFPVCWSFGLCLATSIDRVLTTLQDSPFHGGTALDDNTELYRIKGLPKHYLPPTSFSSMTWDLGYPFSAIFLSASVGEKYKDREQLGEPADACGSGILTLQNGKETQKEKFL